VHRLSTIWVDNVLTQDMGDEAASCYQAIVSADANTPDDVKDCSSVRLVVKYGKDDRISHGRFVPAALRSVFGNILVCT
jgi:hypothetical protein